MTACCAVRQQYYGQAFATDPLAFLGEELSLGATNAALCRLWVRILSFRIWRVEASAY